ncbi:MAG TPA: threonine-phosphate decarboxylase [Methanocellaceae archaeon]
MFKVREELRDVAPCTHGGRLEEIAASLGAGEAGLLDFSVNVNPYPPSDARAIIARAYGEVSRYPDNSYSRFCRSAARFTGTLMENIVPGNGSMEIIRLFAESILEKGDLVAIPSPTFGEYEQQCRLFGAGIRYLRLTDLYKKEYWHLNGCKATFLCNPNNPDGELMSKGDVLQLVDYCKKNNIIVVVDEAFIDLADPEQSVASHVDEYDNLLVLRSLTKCFAIPGFRLGFGVTSKENASLLNKVRLTWNLDSISSEVGIYYMDTSKAYLDVSRTYVHREREWLFDQISAIKGVKALPTSANYFLLDIGLIGLSSTEFTARMLCEKILVRDCGSFKMLGYPCVRLAVRTREVNVRLVSALKKVAGALN